MSFILETPRLMLREVTHDDLDFVAAMRGDREVMRHYPKTLSRDEAAAWIDAQRDRYAQHAHGLWLVLDRRSARPLGLAGVILQHVHGADEREVGYMIHRPYWRQGYASEAAAAARDWVFATLAAPRVISLVRPENVASQAVARKLGMCPRRAPCDHAGLRHMVFEIERME